MKAIHLSDSHGTFPDLPKEGEIVVHSGDFQPNCPYVGFDVMRERKYQRNWTTKRIDTIKEWLGGRPLVMCFGNHDFSTMACADLRAAGVEAYNIDNSWLDLKGISFYGLPYIPFIEGHWNYEKTIDDMKDIFKAFHENVVLVKGMPRVLVCHCPPYGILDCALFLQHIGNTVLSDYISYVWKDAGLLPEWILSGHCHESPGEAHIFGMKVSNAATVVRLIEIP